jgi:hypothetical protein
MRRIRSRLALALATAVAAVGGGLLAAVASATNWNWTSYDLSSQAGGHPSAGRPFVLGDPQEGYTDILVNDGGVSGQFHGDGAQGGVSFNPPSSYASGPQSTGDPSGIKDPQSGDLLIFTDTPSGDLEEYDRTQGSFNWTAYNLTTPNNAPPITGDPSVTVDASTNLLAAAADSANGHLIVYSRTAGGVWSATDVSAITGQSITGNPQAITDPGGQYLDVLAQGTNGHLLQFAAAGAQGWTVYDQTNNAGGQLIASDPVGLNVGGNLVVFAGAPSGDLVAFTRITSTEAWSSQNITSQFGGPTISSDPAPVQDPGGGYAVFAEGTGQHLVEYSGSGANWSSTDLTSSQDGPTVDGTPAAAVSPSTNNLAVWATSGAGNLVEVERTVQPVITTTQVVTVTHTTYTPPPRHRSVDVKVIFHWRWSKTGTRLVGLGLGRLKRGSTLSLSCRGHRCPWRSRKATWGHIGHLERRLANTLFGVGDRIDLQITEPGLLAERVRATVRSGVEPALRRI